MKTAAKNTLLLKMEISQKINCNIFFYLHKHIFKKIQLINKNAIIIKCNEYLQYEVTKFRDKLFAYNNDEKLEKEKRWGKNVCTHTYIYTSIKD